MASLHDLQRAIFPGARPIGAEAIRQAQGEREVHWVRVLRARVPAFESIDAGDLALIPGPSLAMVAPDPPRIRDLAASLARAQVPAVLLVEGETGHASLVALGRAVVDDGLPALDLGHVDPIATERSIIGFLVNRRAELDRRAAELEAQLARYALLGRGLDAQAAAIASFLGRAVVIEGRSGDVLAIHAPGDIPATAAAVARYHARPSGAVALRVGIAGPAGDPGPGGRLVLLGDEAPDEFERIAAERVAGLLGVELARGAARQATDEQRRRDPMPADGPPWVVLLASQDRPDGPPDLGLREAVRGEVRMLFSDRRIALRGSAESLELRVVAAAVEDDREGLAIARRLADHLGRTVALSRPFAERGDRPAAEAAARATLEAAALLPDPPAVAMVSRLPAYLLLGNLRNTPDGQRQAQELLAPLLVGRPERQQERLDTLRAVLGSASLGDAAERLGVHRNTIAYRVRRLEERTGWDLSDPDLRFAVEAAVRIVHHAQN